MTSSLSRKVTIAALIMMASVFLSRVIGVMREMVIARLAGAGGEVDAYQVAFVLPEILNHIAASGFLSITFIPIFSKYLARNDEAEGWRVFSLILTIVGSFLFFLIVIAWIATPQLIALVAPGLRDPLQIESAIRMTRIILPAQLFFFAGGLLMAVQFAKEQFKLPALAPLIYNLGIILGGVLLYRWIGMEGFSWGVLAGAFVGNLGLQYFGARKCGLRFVLGFDFHHPDLKRYVLLSLPLMLGLTMTFSTEVFVRFFGSYLPEGGIAALNYALRVTLILVGLFGQAAGQASYPFLARLAAEHKIGEMNALLNSTLKRYIALVIPISVLMIIIRQEVIMILFQRGEFDVTDTLRTSEALVYLLVGAFGFAAQTVVVRGFYAMHNTLFPTIFATLAVLASLPVFWLGTVQLGAPGIALAISLSVIAQSTLLYALWNRKSGNHESRSVYAMFLKIILLSAGVGSLLAWIKSRLGVGIEAPSFIEAVVSSALVGAAFIVLFAVAAYVFRVREVMQVFAAVVKRRGHGKEN